MSESKVILFSDKVLKIQTICEEADNEYHIMEWLQDKLPVPRVLEFVKDDKNTYLLMTKLPGDMSCADKYIKNPDQLTSLLAEGLQMLWNIDISKCPYTWNLKRKLEIAKFTVENNLVDMDKVEPDTFGENGFKNPNHLLEWLNNNKPKEDLVLSHGDYCLPNIFLANGKVSGYIDLGRTGIADRWQDIALCYRSLLHNFNEKYVGKQNNRFFADMLVEELNIEPDWDKIRYYILLDELF